MIHPAVEEAFQEIDAAMFSSDAAEHPVFRERLAYFLDRWRKRLLDRWRKRLDDTEDRSADIAAQAIEDHQSMVEHVTDRKIASEL